MVYSLVAVELLTKNRALSEDIKERSTVEYGALKFIFIMCLLKWHMVSPNKRKKIVNITFFKVLVIIVQRMVIFIYKVIGCLDMNTVCFLIFTFFS